MNITSNRWQKTLLSQTVKLLRKMSTTESSDVLFETINGNKGLITLNRPKALNALNLSMVNKLYPTLKSWETEKALVIVKGAGGKAFCAGGDVKSIAISGLKGDPQPGKEFFRREYLTNEIIGTYKIPYIAIIDGIVMGGGVGLSVHGHYRIGTERTVFAMPETQIGLFPDVGGSYFLPRLGGKLGLYLALTGERLKGSDVYKAGIATHYCQSADLPKLETDLLACNDDKSIRDVLSKYQVKDSKAFSLQPHLAQINKCFSEKSLEGIIKALESDGSEWAKNNINVLNKMSPTSMKVTMKQLELGEKMSLSECLQMEYRLAVNCLNNKDFYEGVRALLIDKDQKPVWKPAKIGEVTDSIVEAYFSRLPEDQELKHKL